VLSVAVVGPLVMLLSMAMGGNVRVESSEPRYRALTLARSIALRLDEHFSDMEYLLRRLGVEVSMRPDAVDANDTLLRRVKSEHGSNIANIFLLSLDGRNIGNAVGQHPSAGDREYFQDVLATNRLVIGDPVVSRSNLGWVIPVAHPVRDYAGNVEGVLVVANSLNSFREWVGATLVPAGGFAKILTGSGTELMTISDVSRATAPDRKLTGNLLRQSKLGEGSKIVSLPNNFIRTVGFSTVRHVPWLVIVGLPVESRAAPVANRR
jgi:cache domain-containing protein